MSGEVQFEDNDIYSPSSFVSQKKETAGIIGLVLKTGLVKDEKQASYALVAIVIINIIIISVLVFGNNHSSSHYTPLPPALLSR